MNQHQRKIKTMEWTVTLVRNMIREWIKMDKSVTSVEWINLKERSRRLSESSQWKVPLSKSESYDWIVAWWKNESLNVSLIQKGITKAEWSHDNAWVTEYKSESKWRKVTTSNWVNQWRRKFLQDEWTSGTGMPDSISLVVWTINTVSITLREWIMNTKSFIVEEWIVNK